MLPRQIMRVLFTADMKTSVEEGEGIVQVGIAFYTSICSKDKSSGMDSFRTSIYFEQAKS